MRTIKTSYGRSDIQPTSFQIGVETLAGPGTVVRYQGVVEFANGGRHVTPASTDKDKVEAYVEACAQHARQKNFPFADSTGRRIWKRVDKDAPTFG